MSETITEITKALISFHKEVGKIKKEAKNPFFKSSYATLSNILDVIDESLVNNGLTVLQMPTDVNGLTTILVHESGEFFESTYFMTPTKDDPQALGSLITYARRYALGAILSLNIDDDDDGNKASAPSSGNKPSQTSDKPWLNPNTDQWTKAVSYLKGEGTIDAIEKSYRLSTVNKEKLMESAV